MRQQVWRIRQQRPDTSILFVVLQRLPYKRRQLTCAELLTQNKRLKAAGKLPKVVLIACVRKMIVILNTMVKNSEKWEENMA